MLELTIYHEVGMCTSIMVLHIYDNRHHNIGELLKSAKFQLSVFFALVLYFHMGFIFVSKLYIIFNSIN